MKDQEIFQLAKGKSQNLTVNCDIVNWSQEKKHKIHPSTAEKRILNEEKPQISPIGHKWEKKKKKNLNI